MCQPGTISVSDPQVVIVKGRGIHFEICEMNVDDVAFGHLDSLPLMKVVGVVGRVVRRGQHSNVGRRLSGSSDKTPKTETCSDIDSKSPGAPQAFCPDIDPFVDGLLP